MFIKAVKQNKICVNNALNIIIMCKAQILISVLLMKILFFRVGGRWINENNKQETGNVVCLQWRTSLCGSFEMGEI